MLTREQIFAMTAGREMDKLVAERVMGTSGIFNVSEHWFFAESVKRSLPSYSANISHAWEVVEKIQSDGWSWDMVMINVAHEVDVRFGKCRAASKNVPEAVCKAALLTTIQPYTASQA